MQKKILLASSALLATGLVANTAAADGHVSYSITADIAAYTTLLAPGKTDVNGVYKDANHTEIGAPAVSQPATDDNDVNITVKDGDGVSATIDLVQAAGGTFDGSLSVTGDNGLTFSGANDSGTSLTVSGDFGAVYFNGDTAIDQLDIDGDDAAVGLGGAGNFVYKAVDDAGDNADVDSITFVSSTIAGGATVAVTMMNVYGSAHYVATTDSFALKEAGALDFEVAAKYATGPITAFVGFGTHAGSIAVGAKFSQGPISAAFGFSSSPTVVEYAASASDDTDGDGEISDAEMANAIVAAAGVAGDGVASSQANAKADAVLADDAEEGEVVSPGAKLITTGFEAYVAEVPEVPAVERVNGSPALDDAVDPIYGVDDDPTTDADENVDPVPGTEATAAVDPVAAVAAVDAIPAVQPVGTVALNEDFVNANKTGGIAFSVGYTTGAIGASFGVLLPENSDKYSLDSYKVSQDDPNTAVTETEDDANLVAQNVNTATPTIAINFNYDMGPGDFRVQILQQDAGPSITTGIYAAF